MIIQQIACDNCKKVLNFESKMKFENRTYLTLAINLKKGQAHYCIECCNKMTVMDHINLMREKE